LTKRLELEAERFIPPEPKKFHVNKCFRSRPTEIKYESRSCEHLIVAPKDESTFQIWLQPFSENDEVPPSCCEPSPQGLGGQTKVGRNFVAERRIQIRAEKNQLHYAPSAEQLGELPFDIFDLSPMG